MKFKALLLDVDGTLVPVGPHTKPTEKVIDTLKQAHEVVQIALVSGRALPWMEEIFKTLELNNPCIINGGSQIINPLTHEILWEKPISEKSMGTIMGIIKEYKTPFILNDDGVETKNPEGTVFKKPLSVQLSKFDSKESSDKCVMELMKIPDITAHKFYSWDKDKNYKLEVYITHREADKKHAVKELSKLLNVDGSEMVGIGDSRNDIPLLKACGLRIAMGNADNNLKNESDYVAPHVDEDGVAHSVEKFILNGEEPPRRKKKGFFSRIFK